MNQELTIGLVSRIVARYLSGSIVTLGLVDATTGNLLFPDFEGLIAIVLGALIGVATEWFYKLARQWGWAK
jgi:uncharacterized membrane protein YeaQ/YmgE (transglycosylase-associated protein family)